MLLIAVFSAAGEGRWRRTRSCRVCFRVRAGPAACSSLFPTACVVRQCRVSAYARALRHTSRRSLRLSVRHALLGLSHIESFTTICLPSGAAQPTVSARPRAPPIPVGKSPAHPSEGPGKAARREPDARDHPVSGTQPARSAARNERACRSRARSPALCGKICGA